MRGQNPRMSQLLMKRMMPHKIMKGIQWVHREQGPEITALWMQDMYIRLGFSPNAAKLLAKEKGLDSPERPSLIRMLMMSEML